MANLLRDSYAQSGEVLSFTSSNCGSDSFFHLPFSILMIHLPNLLYKKGNVVLLICHISKYIGSLIIYRKKKSGCDNISRSIINRFVARFYFCLLNSRLRSLLKERWRTRFVNQCGWNAKFSLCCRCSLITAYYWIRICFSTRCNRNNVRFNKIMFDAMAVRRQSGVEFSYKNYLREQVRESHSALACWEIEIEDDQSTSSIPKKNKFVIRNIWVTNLLKCCRLIDWYRNGYFKNVLLIRG